MTLTAPTALIRRCTPPSPTCGRRQRIASAAAALHQPLPFPRLRGTVPEGRMGATGAAAARATILIERQKSSTAVLAHRMH
ncbi:hypothetical protein XFF6970_970027 [Xanthomonas citri pv. fuscans]|nr:hypothetical protein XFF6960_1030027 [Xanthomonas citri pv. fuscans]SOO11886.1 hypothetical protein XFF6970_970027 [Xanthomonas citri pv. fuscans]